MPVVKKINPKSEDFLLCSRSSLLELMTTNRLTSRLLQQIADTSTSSIQPSNIHYLIRHLIPFVPSFALDPVGGFVLTSLYNAATVR